MSVQMNDTPEAETEPQESTYDEKREIPKWALIIGLIAFLAFNGLFLLFAMSVGSSNPG